MMKADGIVLEDGGGTEDDYAHLVTDDPDIAKKHEMEDREERKEQFNYFNQYPISDTEHRIHKNSICFKCADIKTCGLARDMWDTPNDYSTFCSAFKPINTEVYDNKGKTLDRYTVIINKAVFTMSSNPLSPQGFNQFAGIVRQLDKASLGKKVDFKQLPQEVRRAIIERTPLPL